MLSDASVARNFGILGWAGTLAAAGGGTIRVAHGILGVDTSEPGELDGIREALDREAHSHPGSREAGLAITAVVGIEELIGRRGKDLEVVLPTSEEIVLAARLQEPTERDWRRSLGIKARRLDLGEAVSVALAVQRGEELATDDDDGRDAYVGLGGSGHHWTRDLMEKAVDMELLREDDARAGYEQLRRDYRFWGPPWP